ncbi:hypothetical protein BKA83DRAFT_3999298, partial [Pisolithus microcarpus]
EDYIGYFITIRGTNRQFSENMPLYASLAVSRKNDCQENKSVEITSANRPEFTKERSTNRRESVNDIPSFVKMYSIRLDEWLGPNIHKYHRRRTLPACRKFKPGTCPFENVDN